MPPRRPLVGGKDSAGRFGHASPGCGVVCVERHGGIKAGTYGLFANPTIEEKGS